MLNLFGELNKKDDKGNKLVECPKKVYAKSPKHNPKVIKVFFW